MVGFLMCLCILFTLKESKTVDAALSVDAGSGDQGWSTGAPGLTWQVSSPRFPCSTTEASMAVHIPVVSPLERWRQANQKF